MNVKICSTLPKQVKSALPYLQIIYLVLRIIEIATHLAFGYPRRRHDIQLQALLSQS